MNWIKIITINLALFSNALCYSSSAEFDPKPTLMELRRINQDRSVCVSQADDHFDSAKQNIQHAANLDLEGVKKSEEIKKFNHSNNQIIEERTLAHNSKINAIRSEDERLLRDRGILSAELTNSENTEKEITGHLQRWLRGPSTPYNRSYINQLCGKLEKLRESINGIKQQIRAIDGRRAALRTDHERNKRDFDSWADNFIKKSHIGHIQLNNELDMIFQNFETSISQFQESYSGGYKNLVDFLKKSFDMDTLAEKFLSTIDDFSDLLCFKEGTQIETPDGPRAIEEIEEGDEVIACNSDQTQCTVQKVTKLTTKKTTFLVEFVILDESVMMTPNHPVYTKNKGWQPAIAIKEGEEVLSLYKDKKGNLILKSVAIEYKKLHDLETPINVYNIEVANDHTYFAGPSRILSHNCDLAKPFEIAEPMQAFKNPSGSEVTLKGPQFSLGLGAIVLVGTPPAGVVTFGVIIAACVFAHHMTSKLSVYNVDFAGKLSIMESRIQNPSRPSRMQQQVNKGQAPRDVERVDRPHIPGQEPHVHFKDGTSSSQSGKVHDAHRGKPNPPKDTKEWLEEHGWVPPKD